MAYDHKINSGTAFKNSNKKGDKAPDIKGELKVVCPHCHEVFMREFAAWVKQGQKGDFYSLKISEPWEKNKSQPDKDFGQEHKNEPLPDSGAPDDGCPF